MKKSITSAAYALSEVAGLLEQAGLQYAGACDGADHGPVREDSERIYVLAREYKKGMTEKKKK